MTIHISTEITSKDKQYINDQLYYFNLKHFPEDLRNRYEEICLFLKEDDGTVRGGILTEVCWNWLEIHILFVDENLREAGYGKQLMHEIEKIAREKQCDFIKVDTLSFQALAFYQRLGYTVYGTLDNVGRDYEHYYLKKDLNC